MLQNSPGEHGPAASPGAAILRALPMDRRRPGSQILEVGLGPHTSMSACQALKRATRTWASALLSLALVGGAIAGGSADAAPAISAKPRRNLVLITLDTTRADHLGSYGWKSARTPNLDALAVRGTRFVRCDTAAPVTLPSHATILTGLFPPRHGVRDNATFVLSPKVQTLAKRLAARGYDTAAVVSAVVLAR